MVSNPERIIQLYETDSGICPFERWYIGIQDLNLRSAIQTKLTLLKDVNYKNYKSLGNGLQELRIFYGSGQRIYFGFEAEQVVILLAGGSKNSQQADIKKAKTLWRDFKYETKKTRRQFNF